MSRSPIPSPPPYERYAAALGASSVPRAPIGLIDLDAMTANAAAMAGWAGGVPLRVATKSLRVRAALEHTLAQPGFGGIMSFALAEALWLMEHGHEDLLVAYPTVDEEALGRLLTNAEARAAITLTVDSADHLDLIDDAARRAGLTAAAEASLPPLRLCLDVDAGWRPVPKVHFGALRSPIRTPEQAAAATRKIVSRPHRMLTGILAYEGQVAGLGEGHGLHAVAARLVKAGSIRDLHSRRRRIAEAVQTALAEHGTALEFVNGGGTGSIRSTVTEPVVTEIGAGSGLLAPASFDDYLDLPLQPAGFFTCPVTRRPGPGIVTVAGGGRVASGVSGKDRSPTVAWPAGLAYSSQEGAGEVQTPLQGPAADGLRIGDPVFFRHAKAGEPAEHTNAVAVYSRAEDAIVDLWPTYRGEGKVFV